jgi:hypothetical protein
MTDLIELKIPPDQAGYAVTDGSEVVSIKLDGGASRRRRDIIGATSTVNVTWNCNDVKFKYLRSFYRAVSESGALPFNIGLILDEPDITLHKAYFVPGSFSLQSQSGLTYVVVAQLEVCPLPVDPNAVDFVTMYNEFGEDSADMLSQTINEDYPSFLAHV